MATNFFFTLGMSRIFFVCVTLLGVLVFSGTPFFTAQAYSPNDTHPDLAREAIRFYIATTGDELSEEIQQAIIQGAIEDS